MNYDNLFENIKDFFKAQYKELDKTNAFLSFEPLGTVIDFPSGASETEAQVIMNDQISIIADKVPEISEEYMTGLTSLSSSYGTLIKTATYLSPGSVNAEDDKKYKDLMSNLLSDAKTKYEGAEKAAIFVNDLSFFRSITFPENWYDANSNIWKHYKFSENDSPGENSGMPGPVTTMRWKIDPKAILTDSPVVRDHRKVQSVAKARLGFFGKKPADVLFAGVGIKTMSFDHSLIAKIIDNRASSAIAEPVVQPPSSPGFQMNFDYCIVNLERSWLKSELFDFSKLFYCLALPEKYFSTGEEVILNKGQLRAVPRAFIVIKDWSIEANWTPQELDTAKKSFGFGFINLQNKQIAADNKKLFSASMQIVGWICEVLPLLPGNADPNF